MLIDIDKIIVRDRIRKDFGDIAELADDIKKNGLINPPAISRSNELIAGERRLRACKSLGWKQIEVHQMDVDDAEKQLYMEISENETRKDFSMTERLDYARRLARVESVKAEQRMKAGKTNPIKNSSQGATVDIVAHESGIGSRDTYRKASFIADNRDMVSPEDFANWDDGKLSTNKLYNQIKQQKHDLAVENQTLKDAHQQLVQKNARLQMELEERKPEVKVVEKAPDDYEAVKRECESANAKYQRLYVAQSKTLDENASLKKQVKDLEDQVSRKTGEPSMRQVSEQLDDDSARFEWKTLNFIKDVGGYMYIADRIDELNKTSRQKYIDAARKLEEWARELTNRIEKITEEA